MRTHFWLDVARVYGALVVPEEDVLELHHPGVGEEQRGVVARDHPGARDHLVATLAEELQEGRTDLVGGGLRHGTLGGGV
jgi:hypothetical protein